MFVEAASRPFTAARALDATRCLFVSTESLDDSACSGPDLVDWGGSDHCRLAGRISCGADHVLSFLVTFFFTRVKKEVTRSSAGGVEALALESYPLPAEGAEALALPKSHPLAVTKLQK